MRALPPDIQTRLNEGATTLARAWILRRADATVMGFTEHDCDLIVDGVVCRAQTGFDGSAAAEKLGFASGHADVAGALVDDAITAADIASGRYDGARVELHLVDWTTPSLAVLLRVFLIGEITREGDRFRAELRALASSLDVKGGRLFTPRCGARLGDARCKVPLGIAARTASGTVTGLEGPSGLIVSGLVTLPEGHLVGGTLTRTAGLDAGAIMDIAAERREGPLAHITLWQPFARPLAAGDTVSVTVGCDHTFAMCKTRFGNAVNFRGFPHMPGADRLAVVGSPSAGTFDGSAFER